MLTPVFPRSNRQKRRLSDTAGPRRPAAFHNSKQRVDPPRCYPQTREAVLDELFDWIIGNIPQETWIAWLNGAAGAGKSAICQSIAEQCIQRGILVASFFFFRTDITRNTINPLVATLAYQIIQLLPQTKDHIVHAIESNPLIFEQTFEAQFDVLIVWAASIDSAVLSGIEISNHNRWRG